MKAGWTIGDGYSLGRHNAFDSANGSRLRAAPAPNGNGL